MLTYRLGAASYAGGFAMARYVSEETLSASHAEERARYYSAEHAPASPLDEIAGKIHRGEVGFGEALDALVGAELHALEPEADFDIDAIEERLTLQLSDAITRADFADELKGETPGMLKPDMSDAMADRLGVDRSRMVTLGGMANLMAGMNAAGGEIEGKHRRSPTIAVQAVFGMSSTALPNADELTHILAGRRVDGTAPQTVDGKPLPDAVVKGAGKRFRAEVGLSTKREPTAAELANVAAGRMASGGFVHMDSYRRGITGTRQPIGFADLTFTSSKSLSSAWSVAETEAERAALMKVHSGAVADAMRFIEDQLGWARKGDGGKDGVERAELAWSVYQHYTARPTLNITRSDAAGNEYTDMREIKTMRADPNVHSHVILLNHALVRETGRLGSVDFDRLNGLVHQAGQVFRAYEAKHGKALGIKVGIGEHGDAQMLDVDMRLQRLHSKRHQDAERWARDYVKDKGLGEWDALTPEQKIALATTAASETKREKGKGAVPDHDYWRQEAADRGIVQKPVLHRQAVQPELAPERRHELARDVLQPMVEDEFDKNSVVNGDVIRALAARSMIISGIGHNAAEDISAITKKLRQSGLRQDGQQTDLVWDKQTVRGKERTVVSTDRHLKTEHDVIALTKDLAADRSRALSADVIERAAAKYLKQHPEIDPAGAWKEQVAWAHKLGEGGRLSLGFGAAGVGKSTVVSILVDAWREKGREVFGAVLSHTQVADMADITEANKTAMDPFLRRAAKGKYALDSKSIIVVDEIGLLGNKQMRDLLKLGEMTGAAIVMIGDPAQCRAASAGDPLELIERALPEAVPELVKSIRQKSKHEMDVTNAFRTDPAVGLAMKIEDGSAHLVAGGSDATIERAVTLQRERMEVNASDLKYSLAVMAPTNATASAVSRAIRADRQQRGEIGTDRIELDTEDVTGRHKLKLAVGDEVRVYRRIWDKEKHRAIANNGEAVRIKAVDGQGMDVRNLKTGTEGRIIWSQLPKEKGGLAWLSYAGCSTVDSAQGRTVSEAVLVMADGTDGAQANKVYTALSRHRDGSYLLVSDAAIRQQIASSSVIGEVADVRHADIWRKVGANISRVQVRENATTSLRQVNREKGTDMEYTNTRKPKSTQEQRDLARHTSQVQQSMDTTQTREVARQAEQERSGGLEY